MIYAIVFGILGALVAGGASGYFLGLYQAHLLDKIRTLQKDDELEAKPTVTLGVLDKPIGVSNVSDKPVGIIESKTPQQIEFEAEQEIEKTGRGIK